MKILNQIEFKNIDSPSINPNTEYTFLYFKPDGLLYRKDSSGNELKIGGNGYPLTQASFNPGSNNDSTQGFVIGDRWINTSNDSEFVATNVLAGDAIWKNTTIGKAYSLYQFLIAPTINDDITLDYLVGDRWVNTLTGDEYVLINNTIGAAIWNLSTSSQTTIIEGDTIIEGNTIINSNITFSGAVAFNNVLTPPIIISDVNDYSPIGVEDCNMIRIESDGTQTITGLFAPDPIINQMIYIVNIGTSTIVIAKNSANSLAENRFSIKLNRNIQSNEGLLIVYDKDSSRWRVVASDI